ncbi:histone H1-delta-like [Haliotis cracherodii]|uniref:histone H1-delta-like n=1 Tax=Haliotis cracherodii TaxID=6455 RepID=UPI0039ED1D02
MSDAEVAAAPAPAAPAKKVPKKKAPAKQKKAASHPKYCDMIKKAISSLKERGGSSRQAILKYIVANYKVESKAAQLHLKFALRAGVKNGKLKQSKGTGASGSFRLGDKAEKAKPKAKKAAKPKAAGAKPKAKKVKKPKAAVAKKSPKKAKKAKAKKPAAAAKPKTAKAKSAKPKTAKKAKPSKKTKPAKK